ncbi:hypothetical protein GGR56DRAFT_616535 [Xylariaceae sp. FL0804]|nr:hypothetical protein GGR56DRAFT_616535 [Xylariaceae sp. FL0804]
MHTDASLGLQKLFPLSLSLSLCALIMHALLLVPRVLRVLSNVTILMMMKRRANAKHKTRVVKCCQLLSVSLGKTRDRSNAGKSCWCSGDSGSGKAKVEVPSIAIDERKCRKRKTWSVRSRDAETAKSSRSERGGTYWWSPFSIATQASQ